MDENEDRSNAFSTYYDLSSGLCKFKRKRTSGILNDKHVKITYLLQSKLKIIKRNLLFCLRFTKFWGY